MRQLKLLNKMCTKHMFYSSQRMVVFNSILIEITKLNYWYIFKLFLNPSFYFISPLLSSKILREETFIQILILIIFRLAT